MKEKEEEVHESTRSDEPLINETSNMTNSRGLKTKISICCRIACVLGQLFLQAAKKLWAFCATAILLLLLLYWVYGSVAALIMLIFTVIGFLYNAQDTLLYYPDNPPTSRLFIESPSVYKMPFENINITTRDGTRINMFLIKRPNGAYSSVPTYVYFHGNAGNIGHRLTNACCLYNFIGCNILLVEYRGYGKSEGSPTENGFYNDAESAIDYLLQRTDIDHKKIIIFGRSLGGAIAIYLASHKLYSRYIWAVILENTFTSLPEIGRCLFNFRIVNKLPDICFKNQYPSIKRIREVKNIPVLFISGMNDQLIPPAMMSQLFEKCGSALKRMARFEHGTHNETWQSQGYFEAISHFIGEINSENTYETRASGDCSISLDSDVKVL